MDDSSDPMFPDRYQPNSLKRRDEEIDQRPSPFDRLLIDCGLDLDANNRLLAEREQRERDDDRQAREAQRSTAPVTAARQEIISLPSFLRTVVDDRETENREQQKLVRK